MDVTFVKMPYSGARNVPELSPAPDYLERGGPRRDEDLVERVRGAGARASNVLTIHLDPDEERESGRWHRMGLACGHLARTVAASAGVPGTLTVGLLGNCTALLGMVGGLQQAGGDGPGGGRPRVGLVFLDAHADFNTPETTLSGMLGGMPVAVAAGLCLRRLRLEAGLDPPLPAESIVMAGVREVDREEDELLRREGVEVLPIDALRSGAGELARAVERLAAQVDSIYVHVDMDVLDPAEVPAHPTAVPGGVASGELAAVLENLFAEPKILALGVASSPAGDRDPDGLARDAAHRLIAAAVRGAAARP